MGENEYIVTAEMQNHIKAIRLNLLDELKFHEGEYARGKAELTLMKQKLASIADAIKVFNEFISQFENVNEISTGVENNG